MKSSVSVDGGKSGEISVPIFIESVPIRMSVAVRQKERFNFLCLSKLEKNTFRQLVKEYEKANNDGKIVISLAMKMVAETEEQVLIFDFSSIVAAVGGSLGHILRILVLASDHALNPVDR